MSGGGILGVEGWGGGEGRIEGMGGRRAGSAQCGTVYCAVDSAVSMGYGAMFTL